MTQFIGTTVSSLCSTLPRPMILTGLFREILVSHFASPEFIEIPELQRLIWNRTESTNILIESIFRWRPELTEHRPGVLIKRNALSNQRLGIGDRHMGNPTDKLGNVHYSTFWVGSHTLFCIGSSGAQADLLATEVVLELSRFGPCIQKNAILHRFKVIEMGAPSELEEARENIVVPVTIGYAYEDRWVLRQEAPTLRSVSYSLITDC